MLEEDKLFATLDPTTRVLNLPGGQKILLTDTVGFISKLPHNLIEAFRSTLEEAKYADVILHVEVRQRINLFSLMIPGPGGMPVGTNGRAMLLLSGGIDSPVAAYRMAKRGLALDHIHFASPPYTSERAKLKVKALAQLTSIYTGSSNLFVVPYTKPQEYIRDNAPDVLFTVLMRRSMMRIANVIAKRQGCEALVTGESLAQVASQTVKALQCTDAAQDLPILRPLIGMDKTEIVETARHINTFETSILPYEDCCTIFTPPHPKIRPELEEILEAEAAMPGLAALEAEAAENAERIRIRITDQVEFEG